MDNKLTDCKIKSNEIVSINKHLITKINENEAIVQTNNEFLSNLFYSNEPVTRDEYVSNLHSMSYNSNKYYITQLLVINTIIYVCMKLMETCTSIDLAMSSIESNEYELQDLHYGFEKALQKFINKEVGNNIFNELLFYKFKGY